MGRFLVTCWPFEGHVMPQMSIAVALRARGHEVAFYTAERAHAMIREAGFEAFGFDNVDPQLYERVQRKEQESGMRRQSMKISQEMTRNWLVETIPGQLADLRPLIERWKPDALITDLAMWGPIYILSESVPIPVALSSTFMGPLMPGPDAPLQGFGLPAPHNPVTRALSSATVRVSELVGLPLRREIDRLRADNGLPAMGCSVARYPARLPLYLVGNLRSLDYGREDLPPSVHYVGPCIWHPPERPGTVEWLAQVPTERPWVHVTEGTSHFQEPFVLKAAVRGLADLPIEAVLTTGSSRDPEELGLAPIPDNVHITQWLSHTDLLPRCAAVVTTGGPATIMAALRAGSPLVIVPTTWDKPDNARRVVEAGAGVRISTKACTPDGLRAAVQQVLDDPSYRATARRIAAELAAAPGPPEAAKLLEQIVPDHRPEHPPVTALGGADLRVTAQSTKELA